MIAIPLIQKHKVRDNFLWLYKPVPIVLVEFIFNLDETGLLGWKDRKSNPVLGPADEEGSALYYPRDMCVRHHTFLCRVSPSGNSHCPMLIAPNAGARKVSYTGVPDTSISLPKSDNQPTPWQIFRSHVTNTFFAALQANRQLSGGKAKLYVRCPTEA
jgi:hypothetical protein